MRQDWGMMYIFTNILCTVKLLFMIKLVVLNYATNGMSL